MVCFLQTARPLIYMMVLCFGLVACGGGDDPEPSPTPTPTTPPADTVPDDITLNPATGVTLSDVVSSNSVAITGIDAATTISVQGGEYALDNSDQFTSAEGTVEVDQTVIVRGTASDMYNTETQVVLTVGGLPFTFSITTVAQDISPAPFSFAPVTGAALTTVVSSAEPVTVTEIDGDVPISITAGGEFSINEGTFKSTADTVMAGDSVAVRLTSAADFGQNVSTTLTIGDATATFTVTTFIADAFTFTNVEGIVAGEFGVSNEVMLTGITGNSPITISGGEYLIDGVGDYTAEEGTITAGQSVTVRVTAGAAPLAETSATLSMGGVSDTFTVITEADSVVPVVNVVFPPENSMTESDTIRVRGTATDASPITSVTITNGSGDPITVESDDNFATWYVDVPLNDGDNTLTIAATDELNNTDDDAAELKVKWDAALGSFPNDENSLPPIRAMELDAERNRLLVSGGFFSSVAEINLADGSRGVISDNSTPNSDDAVLDNPLEILMSPEGDAAYILEEVGRKLFIMDIETNERDLVSDNDSPATEPLFNGLFDMAYDPRDANKVLVVDDDIVISVELTGDNMGLRALASPENDLLTGLQIVSLTYDESRNRILLLTSFKVDDTDGLYSWDLNLNIITEFSTLATHPDSPSFGTSDYNMAIDPIYDFIYVADEGAEDRVLKINLETGERSLATELSTTNPFGVSRSVLSVPEKEYVLVTSSVVNPDVFREAFNTIHAVDTLNGNRVIITKWLGSRLAPDELR